MGHVEEGDADLLLNSLQFLLHVFAQFRVERAHRLVEQQQALQVDQSSGQGRPLLLPAGQLGWPRHVAAGPLAGAFAHAAPDVRSGHPPAAEAERNVVEDCHAGEQRVVLEDRVDITLVRRPVRDVLVAE